MEDAFYELIEHTADVGIRVKAKDLKGLFENSALAMFNIMGQLLPIDHGPASVVIQKPGFKISQKAEDLDELFINWLNELLSLSSVKGLIFTDFIIHKMDKFNIKADVYGEDIKNYKVATEIKAATYHQLKIEEGQDGWQAEVIFDV